MPKNNSEEFVVNGEEVLALAPVLAAVGALAAIVTKCKIIVEKK